MMFQRFAGLLKHFSKMKDPNWFNLKKNKCPFCNHDLEGRDVSFVACVSSKCDFKIGVDKFTKIINNQVNEDLLTQRDYQT